MFPVISLPCSVFQMVVLQFTNWPFFMGSFKAFSSLLLPKPGYLQSMPAALSYISLTFSSTCKIWWFILIVLSFSSFFCSLPIDSFCTVQQTLERYGKMYHFLKQSYRKVEEEMVRPSEGIISSPWFKPNTDHVACTCDWH